MRRRLSRKKLKWLLCITFIVLVYVIYIDFMVFRMVFRSSYADISCYNKPSSPHSFPKFDTAEQSRLFAGRNIFFHETSCFGKETDYRTNLNCRQACAVESAARANPGMSVNLLFLSPSPPTYRTRRLIELLLLYDNVYVNRVHVGEYMREEPLEKWYKDGVLETSKWPRSHMSDIMRYLSLWKFGGIYLDLDVVVIKSLEDLSNFAGAQDSSNIAAGVLGFNNIGLGWRVARACLQDLLHNFRGNKWAHNGPGVITRTLKKLCGVEHLKDMTTEKCNGFKVFPPSTFYPIHHDDWQRYFTEDGANETLQLIKQAKVIHVWNKFSASKIINTDSKVPYALVAERYCPRIYYECEENF